YLVPRRNMDRRASKFRHRIRPLRLFCVAWLAIFLLTSAGDTFAEESFSKPSQEPPNEDRYIYKRIPDVSVTTASSVQSLSNIWRDKPLLLTMVFSHCARVCSPFLRSLNSAISDASGLGAHYHVIVLSFDPQDSVADIETITAALSVKSNANW